MTKHTHSDLRAGETAPRTLVLATRNAHKTKEFKAALEPLGWHILNAADLNLPDVRELTLPEGGTFQINARLKAESACAATGLWCLADDSGICVDALAGGPGVDSAHYGGCLRLLADLERIEDARRTARMECILALARPGLETLFFENFQPGLITHDLRGAGGFGYDYVFTPKGHTQTFAEMPIEGKLALSHRGAAIKLFLGWMATHAS